MAEGATVEDRSALDMVVGVESRLHPRLHGTIREVRELGLTHQRAPCLFVNISAYLLMLKAD